MNWIFFVGLLILFEAIADIFAKESAIRNSYLIASISLFCYVLANMAWLYALKIGAQLSIGGMIFSISSAILAIVIGYFYGEEFSTRQTIGIAVGIISVILLVMD